MKTVLPASIQTIDDAKRFLTDLHNNGETWHPEDNALDCFDSSDVTDEEGATLNRLMKEIYALKGNEDSRNMIFDPCQFLLELDPEYNGFNCEQVKQDIDAKVIDVTIPHEYLIERTQGTRGDDNSFTLTFTANECIVAEYPYYNTKEEAEQDIDSIERRFNMELTEI